MESLGGLDWDEIIEGVRGVGERGYREVRGRGANRVSQLVSEGKENL